MVAAEDAVHEGAVDGAPVHRLELVELLPALGEGGAALAGPHEGVEGEARDAFRMALREEPGLQRARRDAIDEQLLCPGLPEDVFAAGREVVGAVGDVVVLRAVLVGAPIPFVCPCPRCRIPARRNIPSPMSRGVPERGGSKVGCEAIEEPCTKRMVPRGAARGGLPVRGRASRRLPRQCSVPPFQVIVDPSAMRFSMRGIVFGWRKYIACMAGRHRHRLPKKS